MKNRKIVFTHLVVVLLTVAITNTTLFIKQPVTFPGRTVELGYPIHFVTLNFNVDQQTSMSGAPDSFLEESKFNILASWEQNSKKSQINYILSNLIIFFILEIVYFLINVFLFTPSKKQ